MDIYVVSKETTDEIREVVAAFVTWRGAMASLPTVQWHYDEFGRALFWGFSSEPDNDDRWWIQTRRVEDWDGGRHLDPREAVNLPSVEEWEAAQPSHELRFVQRFGADEIAQMRARILDNARQSLGRGLEGFVEVEVEE